MKWAASPCSHCYVSFLVALLIFKISVSVAADSEESNDPFEHFLLACSSGNIEVVEIMLEEHPDFATGQSKQGESCLHVAGIVGQTAVTNAVLKHGGNPNQRSTFVHGLRMTPLSWNVYGGHVETARALLEAGADINMDFDEMTSAGLERVTALDFVYGKMPVGTAETDDTKSPYYQQQVAMKDLLLQYGAKRYAELADSISGEL